jgi:hypothetical protein
LAQVLVHEEPFFHAFALGAPNAYWASDSEWACIAAGAVEALDTETTREAYLQLSEMAAAAPDRPLARKLDAMSVFASLSVEERARVADAVLDTAQHCGDVRVNLFNNGAGPVCVYDRSTHDIRKQIVSYSMLGRATTEDMPPATWEVFSECVSLLDQAEENGEELEWVADLRDRAAQEWEKRSKVSED